MNVQERQDIERQDIERKIVSRVIADALAAGFVLTVHDGESAVLRQSNDAAAIEAAMFSTDEEALGFVKDGKYVGSVQFVYGNTGWDVIADNSISLEGVLAGATAYAETFEE